MRKKCEFRSGSNWCFSHNQDTTECMKDARARSTMREALEEHDATNKRMRELLEGVRKAHENHAAYAGGGRCDCDICSFLAGKE